MHSIRLSVIMATLLVAACDRQIYVKDGVTDGDTFYVSEAAATNPDPVVQSWVAYSLARSVCQLELARDNPARASSYNCELKSRRILAQTWLEHLDKEPQPSDRYLDALLRIRDAGYLEEYSWHYYQRRHWQAPADLDQPGFKAWRKTNLRGHRARTRWVGSWNYARNTGPRS